MPPFLLPTGARKALDALGLLIIAAAWFSAAAALAAMAPAALRSGGPPVAAVAAAAAVGGAVAGAAPTGLGAFDAALAGALTGGLSLAAARAHPVAVVVAAGLVAIAGVDADWAWPAFAGVGVALASLTTGVRGPVLGAVAGAMVAQTALRLEQPGVGVSALVAAVALTIVAVPALAASAPRLRRRVLMGAGAVLVAAGMATAALGAATLAARPQLERAVATARDGFDASRAGNTEAGVRQLELAAETFSEAEERLAAWWLRPARLVPAVARNALALEQVASSGADLARVAAGAASEADPGAVRLRGGAIDVAAIEALRQPLARVAAALSQAETELAAADSPWLAPPLRRALDDLAGRVGDAAPAAADAVAVAEVAPAFLGGDGPRRYFLALLTPVELRGSGGLLGNFGEVTATDGRLDLVRTGRSTDLTTAGGGAEPGQLEDVPAYLERFERRGWRLLWGDITLSPHFPAVADTIERFYPHYGGSPVDGVISLDSLALAALLELTGPVSVAEWPEPIGADNAADVLLREQYVRLGNEGFTNPERVEFLDSLVQAVFDRLQAGELPGPAKVAEVLGPMVRQGRIQLHSTVAREQAVFEDLGAAGALAPVVGDYAAVVTNNSGGNKIDLFLDRALSYRVGYDPATGATSATAEIRLHNRAPAEGPEYLIGSGGPVEVPPGTNRLWLSFYSALALNGATIEGQPLPMEVGREQERSVYSAFVAIPPGESRTVTLELSGALAPDSTYRLDLGHQATIEPDAVEVHVVPAPGWRLGEVNGVEMPGQAPGAALRLALDHERWLTAGFARR
ncbi:MAG: DUF4012 domain-containing protein [Actinobacteria bacterium]|nr:DUF4012 domain-containing protein [Actinomycetota bacterium]